MKARVKTKIQVSCPLLEHAENWNHDMVRSWGVNQEVESFQVLIVEASFSVHPLVLKSLLACKRPTKTVEPKPRTVVRRVGRPVE